MGVFRIFYVSGSIEGWVDVEAYSESHALDIFHSQMVAVVSAVVRVA